MQLILSTFHYCGNILVSRQTCLPSYFLTTPIIIISPGGECMHTLHPYSNLLAGLHIYQWSGLQTGVEVDVVQGVVVSRVPPPSGLEVSGVVRGPGGTLPGALTGLTDYHDHLRLSEWRSDPLYDHQPWSSLQYIHYPVSESHVTLQQVSQAAPGGWWWHNWLWLWFWSCSCGLHSKLVPTVSTNNLTYNSPPGQFTLHCGLSDSTKKLPPLLTNIPHETQSVAVQSSTLQHNSSFSLSASLENNWRAGWCLFSISPSVHDLGQGGATAMTALR